MASTRAIYEDSCFWPGHRQSVEYDHVIRLLDAAGTSRITFHGTITARTLCQRRVPFASYSLPPCCPSAWFNPAPLSNRRAPAVKVLHKTVKVGDLDIFYREAGPKDAPAILLLHGFPTSSQMFRNLIPALADKYRVVAPDYPGYGHSSMPTHDKFAYTFDNLAKVIDEFTEKVGLTKYALYVQDYGAPVGYRLAVAHPERITAIVVQNGNAYDEGLDNDFWKPIKAYWKEPKSKEKRDAIRNLLTYEATKWQYTTG